MTRSSVASRVCAVSAAVASALALCAAAQAQATDLVGRNGQFTVKDKGGNVETVDAKRLDLPKETRGPAPSASVADADTAPKDEKPAAKSAGDGATADAPKEDTPEEKAIRAADVEALRAMRNQGGAYFYTEDNKPVSFEEIDRRIETGEVEGLKAVGLHLEDWKPQTKAKSAAPAETAPQPPPAPAPAPKKKY